MSASAQQAVSRIVHKLGLACGKPDLASEHWNTPGDVESDDIGAVGIVRVVAGELGALYCALND